MDGVKTLGGVADATQKVLVGDRENYVALSVSSLSPAGLTADEARFLAQALNDAADRLEQRQAEKAARSPIDSTLESPKP